MVSSMSGSSEQHHLADLFTWRTVVRAGLAIALEYVVLALIEDAPLYLKITTGVLAALGLLALQLEPTLRRYNQYLVHCVLAVLAIAYAGVVVYSYKTLPSKSPTNLAAQGPMSSPSNAASTLSIRYFPLPLTLRNLFDTDDFKSLGITNDATILNPLNGHHNTVTVRLFEDLNEKVEFFSVFIPHSPDAFDLCVAVAGHYKSILNQLHQHILVGTVIPGETAETWSRDLTFSGRVYIYLDDDLSLQQLATLEKFYNQNGLSPEFRSRAFLTLHWMEKREILKTYIPPKR